MILLKKHPHLFLKIPLAVMHLLSFDVPDQRTGIRRPHRKRPVSPLPREPFHSLRLHPLRRVGLQFLQQLRQADRRMQPHGQMNMVGHTTNTEAITLPIAHDRGKVRVQSRSNILTQQRATILRAKHNVGQHKTQRLGHSAQYRSAPQSSMRSASPLALSPALASLATLALLLTFAFPLIAQSTTIRIRFANGKNGKPLRLKIYEEGVGRGFNLGGKYTIDRVDGDTLFATLTDVSTFQFRSAGFEPCDVAKKNDAQPKYDVAQVVKEGIVAPNFCGPTLAKPVPGELLIYSRHEHWWEISKRVLQGLLICG
jgi:hypothetical protein